MKKIVSLLIAPLLAVSMLFGCSKVEYTATDVQDVFNEYMDSYISSGENDLFLNNVITTGSEGDETDSYTESEITYRTYEKIMYITYEDDYYLNSAVKSTVGTAINTIKAQQLRQVYQRILSLTFNYYAEWNENFYQNIGDTEITPEELNALHELVFDLKDETDAFVAQKLELEREIRINANHLSGALVSAKFDEFNTAYNNLVKSSFAFVNEFKNLHKKYIFNTTDITPNTAKQLVDESLLMIAEAVFYDNVLAFQNNTATELQFMNNVSEAEYTNRYNWLSKTNWQYLTLTDENNNLYANTNTKAQLSEESSETVGANLVLQTEYKEQAVKRVQELRTYANSFAQDLQNYKTIFKNASKTNYNYARGLADASSAFDENKLSYQEQSNLQYMKNFSASKIFGMFNALF